MDGENKGKSFGVGGYRGRIIFLGDGTEVLTDSDDTEMFDNTDEDKDLESQVAKGTTAVTSKDDSKTESTENASESRTESKTESNNEGKASTEAKKAEPTSQESKKD